jgi:hypothetical protein
LLSFIDRVHNPRHIYSAFLAGPGDLLKCILTSQAFATSDRGRKGLVDFFLPTRNRHLVRGYRFSDAIHGTEYPLRGGVGDLCVAAAMSLASRQLVHIEQRRL